MTRALTPLRAAAHHALLGLVVVQVLATSAQAWLAAQDEKARNDRGSDSTEKALMILAGVLIAGLVTAAVTNYVTKKSGEIVKQK